jgi:hypothetical protein
VSQIVGLMTVIDPGDGDFRVGNTAFFLGAGRHLMVSEVTDQDNRMARKLGILGLAFVALF